LKLPRKLKEEDVTQKQQKKANRGATISPLGRRGF